MYITPAPGRAYTAHPVAGAVSAAKMASAKSLRVTVMISSGVVVMPSGDPTPVSGEVAAT
jgi:hypothetical protein